jgi:transcriptional regulator with XRE-family HTH domain
VKAGDRLRLIRSKLGISTREVEDFSRQIALQKGNEEFFISHGWMTKIENNDKTPSICKLFSLCAIYRMKFTDLLMLFEVDLTELAKFSFEHSLPQTHLSDASAYDLDRTVNFPVRFDPGFDLSRSSLLARMVEAWSEIPLGLLQHLNMRQHLYGYVGLQDNSMTPLIRPGSFVQIDDTQTKVSTIAWKHEYERPIFFVELRDGYACSWCDLQGKQLFLIPHPLSGYPVRQFTFPGEADVVGRVTAVAMRLCLNEHTNLDRLPTPPAKS